MRTADQLCLLEKYLHWCIDVRKPITIKKQIEIYNKRGFIEHGKNENELPTFEQWKLVFNPQPYSKLRLLKLS